VRVGIRKSKKPAHMAGFFSSEIPPFLFSAKALTVMGESDPKGVARGPYGEKRIILSTRGRVAGFTSRLPLIAKA